MTLAAAGSKNDARAVESDVLTGGSSGPPRASGRRFAQITTNVPPEALLAWPAHEFQHAVGADSPHVTSAAALARFYQCD